MEANPDLTNQNHVRPLFNDENLCFIRVHPWLKNLNLNPGIRPDA